MNLIKPVILLCLFAANLTHSQDLIDSNLLESELDSLRQKIQKIDQTIRIIERTSEIDKEESNIKSEKATNVSAGQDGIIVQTSDSAFQMRLRFEGQFDGRYFLQSYSNSNLQPSFYLKRVRTAIDAKVPGPFVTRFYIDFANGKLDLLDAYIESGFDQRLGFRIGKFKSQVSLEILQSTAACPFLELSIASQLAPNRDIGIQCQGRLGDGFITYTIGGVNGGSDGTSIDSDYNRSKDIVGRLFLQPFKNIPILKGLGVGSAFSSGNHTDPRDIKKWSSSMQPLSVTNYKSAGQQTFFKYRDTSAASGNQNRYSIGGYYYLGPFAFMSEFLSSSLPINLNSSNKGVIYSHTIENIGWHASALFVLTGESNSYKSLKPFRQFDLSKNHYGAFELSARAAGIQIDKDAFAGLADSSKSSRKAFEFTGGINWYANRNMKMLLNYTNTRFAESANSGNFPDEYIIAGRIQIVF